MQSNTQYQDLHINNVNNAHFRLDIKHVSQKYLENIIQRLVASRLGV